MLKEFSKKGIKIEKIYFCPHSPQDSCDCRKPNPKFAKDAAKKKFYRAYELIYGKKYNSDEYERPLIKKQYMKRYCNTCEQRPACKEPCPDVIGYVDQDSKNYQREMTGGNTIDTMAKLKKGRQKEDSTVSDMYEDPDMIGPE